MLVAPEELGRQVDGMSLLNLLLLLPSPPSPFSSILISLSPKC